MFGHSVIIFFFKPKKWVFCNFRTGFFFFCFYTYNHRHLFTFFLIVMRENMAKIRVGGENWWKSCFVFCLLRFSKHKSICTVVLFCIIVGGGSRKVFLRSFFFLQEKLEKRWNSVGFSSVNIVDFFCGFHRDVLLLLKLYTLVEEPSLDQISQALQATVFCNWKKKKKSDTFIKFSL